MAVGHPEVGLIAHAGIMLVNWLARDEETKVSLHRKLFEATGLEFLA